MFVRCPKSRVERVAENVLKLSLWDDDKPLTFAQVIELLSSRTGFCHVFNEMLAQVDYSGYFWEWPALTLTSLHQPFECVVVKSGDFDMMAPDPSSFAKYFNVLEAEAHCAVFENLGGDACLISPTPFKSTIAFPHLAHFVRHADGKYIEQLWSVLARTIADRVSHQPLWVSTSGLGVHWLHIRLDQKPKYYTYEPYIRVID